VRIGRLGYDYKTGFAEGNSLDRSVSPDCFDRYSVLAIDPRFALKRTPAAYPLPRSMLSGSVALENPDNGGYRASVAAKTISADALKRVMPPSIATPFRCVINCDAKHR
jgi:hypothetical protein